MCLVSYELFYLLPPSYPSCLYSIGKYYLLRLLPGHVLLDLSRVRVETVVF